MGLPQEVTEEIFQVIQGGANLGSSAQIVQFPTDNASTTYQVVEKAYRGTNGTGFNYWVAAAINGATAVSAGVAMLALPVTEAAMLAAPALGIATGYTMYNLTPTFWDGVADAILDAGGTINGKVITFLNDNGVMLLPESTIDIFKDKFMEAGIFNMYDNIPEYRDTGTAIATSNTNGLDLLYYVIQKAGCSLEFADGAETELTSALLAYPDTIPFAHFAADPQPSSYYGWGGGIFLASKPQGETVHLGDSFSSTGSGAVIRVNSRRTGNTIIINDIEAWAPGSVANMNYWFVGEQTVGTSNQISGLELQYVGNAIQKGALLPDEDPFPLRYPEWHPYEFPDIPGVTLPTSYPLEFPDLLPEAEPYQKEAQNPVPAEFPDPAKRAEEVIETIADPANDPNKQTEVTPSPGIDPDAPAVEDPIENPGDDGEHGENPPEPDPTPIPSPIIPIPNLPDTVDSNKLFTVYNPTSSQLDELGGYLWDDNLIETLKRIWQNPLDGIISLIQVYATPVTGGSHNIILGYLDSGVSAAVVTQQFVTINCGSIQIKEKNENATDYTPYTQIQIYLPFIGITEIDTNEFMEGTISVTYKVDVYTGTCLAEVKCTRPRDMPGAPILYTFSGNCSQQLPLTSGDMSGLLSTLVSAAGAGLSIASGGSFGAMRAAGMAVSAIQSDISRSMLHVSHSGNISANAGIMGQKKPYVIINRMRPYNANDYNKQYGYPSNKAVILGNCTGFNRVKACRLKTSATQTEQKEMLDLLHNGIIM